MNNTPEVVIIGHLGVNRTKASGKTTETLGGAAYHAAVGALTVKDCRVAVVARVGEDDLGNRIIDALNNFGVNVQAVKVVKGASTATFSQTESPGGVRGSIKVKLGAAGSISTKEFPSSWGRVEYVHLATAPPEQYLGWIRDLRKRGRKQNISIDAFELYALRSPKTTLDAMVEADLVFLNQTELFILQQKSGRTPYPDTPYILKMGAGGAEYVDTVHKANILAQAPSVTVFDTTGAGDVLAGAQVAALAKGWDIQEALFHAVDVASTSITRPGVEHILGTHGMVYER